MPCLSSCLPGLNPAVPFSTTNQVGPPGVLARIEYRSATPPLEIHCFVPLIT